MKKLIKKQYVIIIGGLIAWRVTTVIFAYIAQFFLPLINRFTVYFDYYQIHHQDFGGKLPYLVNIWSNFDGYFYMKIAKSGYYDFEQPFFPLYPLAIRFVHTFTHLPYVLSGLLISHIAFIFALYVIVKLLTLDGKRALLPIVLLAILTFPTSYSYGAVYNDSLFFLFLCSSLYFARQRNWVLASVAGSLATLTRLNGLAIIFPLFIEYLQGESVTDTGSWSKAVLKKSFQEIGNVKKMIREKLYTILGIPIAFLGYLYYVENVFGDWNKVFSAMSVWGQEKVTFPLQVFWRYGKILVLNSPDDLHYWVAVFELFMVLFYVFILFWSFKKIRLSYWVLFALSLIIPSLTGTFAGMPRYGLHLYPLFLGIALFLSTQKKWMYLLYFALATALLFFAVTLFTRGYFIA